MPNLVEVIKKVALEAVIASNPTSLVVGMVTSTSPLQITIEQRLMLDEDFLILTKHVTDHYVDVTVSHSTKDKGVSGLTHSHTYKGTTKESSVDGHTHVVPLKEGNVTSEPAKEGTTSHTHLYEGETEKAFAESAEDTTKHAHEYKGRKKVLIHYGLKQGESVLLIRMQGGQKYLVLDRIGEVPVKGEWIQ